MPRRGEVPGCACWCPRHCTAATAGDLSFKVNEIMRMRYIRAGRRKGSCEDKRGVSQPRHGGLFRRTYYTASSPCLSFPYQGLWGKDLRLHLISILCSSLISVLPCFVCVLIRLLRTVWPWGLGGSGGREGGQEALGDPRKGREQHFLRTELPRVMACT